MADISNLKVTKETKQIIDKLVDKHGGLQRDFIHKMVVYFQNTGTDPDTYIMPSPAEELKKFRDTIISFMRKQESDFIKPTFGKMQSLMEMMVRFMEEEKAAKPGNKELKAPPEKQVISPTERQELTSKESEELKRLENELDIKKQQLSTMKQYFLEVCNSVEKKSTGMQKKNVVNMDEARFQDTFKWLRTFEI